MNKWPFYLAGAGGGALTATLDFFKDWHTGTVARVSSVLGEHLLSGATLFNLRAPFWTIILIVATSLFVCWVFEVTSRLDGFLRGCTVVAAFSIGAPNPIIDEQHIPAGNPKNAHLVGPTQLSVFQTIVPSASAQNRSPPISDVGEAYVRLEHLREVTPIPQSTITIRDDSSRIISLFKINTDTIRIIQPYGNYLVEVETPGFRTVDFELTISQPVSGSRISAGQSSIPVSIQKMVSATKVTAAVDEAEKYKQIGRQERFAGNWDAAISNYEKSLEINQNDAITHDYLGYAYFRQGKFDEAVKQFQLAIEHDRNYVWSYVNLIKVDCAQQRYDEARQKLKSLQIRTDVWKSDVELGVICKPILG